MTTADAIVKLANAVEFIGVLFLVFLVGRFIVWKTNDDL